MKEKVHLTAPAGNGDNPALGIVSQCLDALAQLMGYVYEVPDMGYVAEAPVEGYVRERDASPRVVPLENIGDVEGYYRPRTINPSVETFRPPEEAPQPTSTWFQPPW
jgi:hypothetical protein